MSKSSLAKRSLAHPRPFTRRKHLIAVIQTPRSFTMKSVSAIPERFLARCATAECKSRPCGSCQTSSRTSMPSCNLAGRCLAPLRSRASSINRIHTYLAWAHRAKCLPRSASVASPRQRLKDWSCQPPGTFCNTSKVRYAGASHVRHAGYLPGTHDETTARFHLARHGNGSCVGVASSLSFLAQAKALPPQGRSQTQPIASKHLAQGGA